MQLTSVLTPLYPERNALFSAFIYFSADPSVGLLPFGYTMQLPDFRLAFGPSEKEQEKHTREQVREQLKEFYQLLDGEFSAVVYFSDESDLEAPDPAVTLTGEFTFDDH